MWGQLVPLVEWVAQDLLEPQALLECQEARVLLAQLGMQAYQAQRAHKVKLGPQVSKGPSELQGNQGHLEDRALPALLGRLGARVLVDHRVR